MHWRHESLPHAPIDSARSVCSSPRIPMDISSIWQRSRRADPWFPCHLRQMSTSLNQGSSPFPASWSSVLKSIVSLPSRSLQKSCPPMTHRLIHLIHFPTAFPTTLSSSALPAEPAELHVHSSGLRMQWLFLARHEGCFSSTLREPG